MSFSEYLILIAMDVPLYQSIILESRTGLDPFGATGVFDLRITPEQVARPLRTVDDAQ